MPKQTIRMPGAQCVAAGIALVQGDKGLTLTFRGDIETAGLSREVGRVNRIRGRVKTLRFGSLELVLGSKQDVLFLRVESDAGKLRVDAVVPQPDVELAKWVSGQVGEVADLMMDVG